MKDHPKKEKKDPPNKEPAKDKSKKSKKEKKVKAEKAPKEKDEQKEQVKQAKKAGFTQWLVLSNFIAFLLGLISLSSRQWMMQAPNWNGQILWSPTWKACEAPRGRICVQISKLAKPTGHVM